MSKIPIPQPTPGPTETALVRQESTVDSNNIQKHNAVSSSVSVRPETFNEKLKKAFTKEDMHSVRDHVIFDLLIPNVKKGIYNIICGVANQFLDIIKNVVSQALGVPMTPVKSQPAGNVHIFGGVDNRVTNYATRGGQQRAIQASNTKVQQYTRYDVGRFSIANKSEANGLLETIIDIIDTRGYYTVYEYFQELQIESEHNAHTNWNFGWTSSQNLDVIPAQAGNGWSITFPFASPLQYQK